MELILLMDNYSLLKGYFRDIVLLYSLKMALKCYALHFFKIIRIIVNIFYVMLMYLYSQTRTHTQPGHLLLCGRALTKLTMSVF